MKQTVLGSLAMSALMAALIVASLSCASGPPNFAHGCRELSLNAAQIADGSAIQVAEFLPADASNYCVAIGGLPRGTWSIDVSFTDPTGQGIDLSQLPATARIEISATSSKGHRLVQYTSALRDGSYGGELLGDSLKINGIGWGHGKETAFFIGAHAHVILGFRINEIPKELYRCKGRLILSQFPGPYSVDY